MPLPLPSPGSPISINQIRDYYDTSSGSLRYLSSLAGLSTPDSMSEFYSPGLTPFFVSIPTSIQSKICSNNYPCCIPVWHNGASALPTIGDFVYTDSAGTTPLAGIGGENWFGMDSVECKAAINWLEMAGNGSGIVVDTGSCF